MTTQPIQDTQQRLPPWSLAVLCGPTPDFAHSGVRATLDGCITRDQWQVWNQALVQILGGIARVAPDSPLLTSWVRTLEQTPPTVQHPVERAWWTLQWALALPAYAAQFSAEDQRLRLYTACPYSPLVRQALDVTREALLWAHALTARPRMALDRAPLQRWVHQLGALPSLHPDPEIMAWHQDLTQAGTPWHWQGGQTTRVGYGDRQQSVQGVDRSLLGLLPQALTVPIYTVTGSIGKTTTVRLMQQLLSSPERQLVVTASDGVWFQGQPVATGDAIGGRTARDVLRHPHVQAALLEIGRGGLIEQGLPFAHSDVAVLLNVQEVQLGHDGVETLDAMADVKAQTLAPARVAVLNADDAQCQRLGGLRAPSSCVWFSVSQPLAALMQAHPWAQAWWCVLRDAHGQPTALHWQQATVHEPSQAVAAPPHQLSLEGVAPFHGQLGDKTLEELLAACAAVAVGPLPVALTPARLQALQLNADNHAFRGSHFCAGPVVYVLDKAGEPPALALLQGHLEQLRQRYGIERTLAVVLRSAATTRVRYEETALQLYDMADALVSVDRPEAYAHPSALKEYRPGDVPQVFAQAWQTLNQQRGLSKPIDVWPEWSQAESLLVEQLHGPTPTLVLINHSATNAPELNARILAFVRQQAERSQRIHDPQYLPVSSP